AEERARLQARDDVYAFDEDYKHRHLWRASAATGAEQRLTDGDFSVVAFRVSRDGAHVAFHRMPSPLTLDNPRSETSHRARREHSIPLAPAPAWNLAAAAGRLVFVFDEPTRFGDAWTLATTRGAQPV